MYLPQINQRIILGSSQTMHCYLINVKGLLLGYIRSITFGSLLPDQKIKILMGRISTVFCMWWFWGFSFP